MGTDAPEQSVTPSSAKPTSSIIAENDRQDELQNKNSQAPPSPSPISPNATSTDDLSVEPMSMEDDTKGNTEEQVKIIPRLVDSAGQAAMPRSKDNNLNPTSWTVQEVAQFLQINECATLADAFQEQNVDGEQFLSMEKSDIMKLVNNKIGPSLKVENLLRLLKSRINPAQARFVASMSRKSM